MNIISRGIVSIVVGHVAGSVVAASLGCTAAIVVDVATGNKKKSRNSGAVTAMVSYGIIGIKTTAAVWRATGK